MMAMFARSSGVSSLKDFVVHLHQFEENLFAMKVIQENLLQYLELLSLNQQHILEQYQTLREHLPPTFPEPFQDEEEIVPIDSTKSEWDDDEDEDEDEDNEQHLERKFSPSTNRTDFSSINSVSSSSTLSSVAEPRNQSLKNIRLSNLKKSEQFSTRSKSSKSVTFTLDQSSPLTNNEQNNPPLLEVTTSLVPSSHLSEGNSLLLGRNLSSSIRIHEIDALNGEFLRLLNVSNSDDYDLTDHFLQQNLFSQILSRYRFPPNTVLRAGQTLTIYCGNPRDIHPHPPYLLVWKEQRQWQRSPQCLTLLLQPNGKIIDSYRQSSRLFSDCSSSDILYLHSKSTSQPRQISSILPSRLKKRPELSVTPLSTAHKPAFAHSTTNVIHPDHHPSLSNLPTHFRSPPRKVVQLLRRPKSSPFASHRGSKQDTLIRQFLHQPASSSSNTEHRKTLIQT